MKTMEIIDSIGIELEFSNIDRNTPKFKSYLANHFPHFRRAHDASCESPSYLLNKLNVPIIKIESQKDFDTLSQLIYVSVIGGEIISPVCNSKEDQLRKDVENICKMLIKFGETENTPRGSLHVHINVTSDIPLYAILNLLKLEAFFEAILYRLSSMGRMNRGTLNNYIFQRPFLGKGPPVVRGNKSGEYYPIISYDDLLNSSSKAEFFSKYGDAIYHGNNGVRYITSRYMCVNFYPILTQGSFEFRTANKTLNPLYILAWIDFCKAIVEKAFSSRNSSEYDRIKRPLHENRVITTEEFLDSISILPNIDVTTRATLKRIWESSPTPLFDNQWIHCHLENPTNYGDIYHPPIITDISSIKKPLVTNVHNLTRNFKNFRVTPKKFKKYVPNAADRALLKFSGMVVVNDMGFELGRILLRNLKPYKRYIYYLSKKIPGDCIIFYTNAPHTLRFEIFMDKKETICFTYKSIEVFDLSYIITKVKDGGIQHYAKSVNTE